MDVASNQPRTAGSLETIASRSGSAGNWRASMLTAFGPQFGVVADDADNSTDHGTETPLRAQFSANTTGLSHIEIRRRVLATVDDVVQIAWS